MNITGPVLIWAREEDGLSLEELAAKVDVEPAMVQAWETGQSHPSRGEFSRLVQALRRPRAIFYLPEPPSGGRVPADLRSAPGLLDHSLSVTERRLIRRAQRLQEEASWLLREEGGAEVDMPRCDPTEGASQAGERLRSWLGATLGDQLSWDDEGAALRAWRGLFEDKGVLVLLLQLGGDGIRGFSLQDGRAPVVALNTTYNNVARTFTMFHELAHLAARTESACSAFYSPYSSTNSRLRLERWCEEVAASALLPSREFRDFVRERFGVAADQQVADFETVQRIARRLKVSIRTTAIRLIQFDLAPRGLYELVDRQAQVVDRPRPGGGGGGRVTARKRLDELGGQATRILLGALEERRIPMSDAAEVMGVKVGQLSEMRRLLGVDHDL